MKSIKFLIPLIITLFTGCGLHLQNYANIPPWFNNVAVINEDVKNDLRPEIIEQLKAYKINICTNPKQADYLLILEKDKNVENITAVSSSTTPRQYQMTYAIKYKVRRARDGVDVIPASSAVVTRQFTINSNRILGSDYEGDTLRQEMCRDAVAQILDHIENSKYAN